MGGGSLFPEQGGRGVPGLIGQNPQVARPSRSQRRLWALGALGCLWAAAVVGRLVQLQLFEVRHFRTLALRQQERIIETAPERGTILDRNGRPLAVSLPVQSCFAVPAEIANPDLAAGLLAPILEMPAAQLRERLTARRGFVWVARRLPPDVVARIQALNLRGIYFEPEMQRFYPNGTLAAQVLGFVDIDGHGQAGIEYALDREIAGRPGRVLLLADGRGRFFERREQPAQPGARVQLTLDETIQYIAERELAQAVTQAHAVGGTAIVQDPATGDILAMASWPTFDPNRPGASLPASRQNRAVSDIYEPGSTFKIVTLGAALDAGLVRPDDVVDCQMGRITVGGRVIHDWKRFGLLTVAQVLAHSSDVGAIKIALRLGPDAFYRYIRAFGFGQRTGIPLPWESPGLLRPPSLWSASSIGSLAMGQEVGVTALQMVTAVSAVAAGGLWHRPRIVRTLEQHGQTVGSGADAPVRVLRPETAATLAHLMEGVVLEGTGRSARLEGYTAAGKTGTAQKVDPQTGRYSRDRYVASFVGFAPLNNPAVTILVVIDSPVGAHHGGEVAAPVFQRIAQQVLTYLGVPRDLPLQAPGRAGQVETAKIQPRPAAPVAAPDRVPTSETPAPDPAPPGTLAMPALIGQPARQAVAECLRLHLQPVLVGSGVAVGQDPQPGAAVRRGQRVTVWLAAPASAVAGGRGGGP